MLPERTDTAPHRPIALRAPSPEDGAAMWSLVGEISELERNSAYFYLLYCIDFADSCLVAEADGALAGFVLGHRPPARTDTLFVWQIGVAPWMRRHGLAGRMLHSLLSRQNPPVRWLEATVAPDNSASSQTFRSLARAMGATCAEGDFMTAELFPENHSAERLFRIGPLSANQRKETTS